MTLIDQIASAIYTTRIARVVTPLGSNRVRVKTWREITEEARDRYREEAIAALAAAQKDG